MKLVFLETPLFTRLLGNYLTDESYRELQRALMENPEMGDVMPGTGVSPGAMICRRLYPSGSMTTVGEMPNTPRASLTRR